MVVRAKYGGGGADSGGLGVPCGRGVGASPAPGWWSPYGGRPARCVLDPGGTGFSLCRGAVVARGRAARGRPRGGHPRPARENAPSLTHPCIYERSIYPA